MDQMHIQWLGPFGMPKYEGELPKVSNHPGVYLYTVEYAGGGYLVCSPGITQRAIKTRMMEHTRSFLKGNYNILDTNELQQARRLEIWHGWGWNEEKRNEFERRKEEIVQAAERQLRTYRIFTTGPISDKRILERIEASVMQALYQLPSPHRDVLDEGMHFSARKDGEDPILVHHSCPAILHGLPSQLVM